MDARAHLRGLGWQGEGHSLGKNGGGIKKPLLITHKTGLHGLGAKSQKEKQADQWWLNAFDNALKDMGTGKESSLAKIKDNGAGKGGLYGWFVRGPALEGTIDTESTTGTSTPTDVHNSTTTTVILSVKDIASNDAEARQLKRERKEKKALKKRKRDEDPVDSHQDEPEVKQSKLSVDKSEPSGFTKMKKSKSKKEKRAEDSIPTPPKTQAEESMDTDSEPRTQEISAGEKRAQKEERRRARADRRAAKEAKRKRKEVMEDSISGDPGKVRKSKKSKKSKPKQPDGT